MDTLIDGGSSHPSNNTAGQQETGEATRPKDSGCPMVFIILATIVPIMPCEILLIHQPSRWLLVTTLS